MRVTQISKYKVDLTIDDDLDKDELIKMLAEELAKEIDKEVLIKMRMARYEAQGWHQIFVKSYEYITDEWCQKYLAKQYACYGHYWYFESEKDAHFFLLKWG